MSGRMVRVDEILYGRLKQYEKVSGVPIARSVNDAVANFVECVLPPRLEFLQMERQSRLGPVAIGACVSK